MKFVNKILLFTAFLGIGFWVSGWLPSKVMQQSENNAMKKPDSVQVQNKSRVKFLNEVVPEYYPLLTGFLRENKSESLPWETESGENKKLYLSFSNYQGLAVETEIFIGATNNDMPVSTQSVQVRMIDNNTDGIMDSIEFIKSDGDSKLFRAPFDQGQQYLWDTSLLMAFRLSRCCQKN